MKKVKIAIASVLKPVTEPRAYRKLAISLRETNKYHINIIGFYAKRLPKEPDIEFTCIFKRNRTHVTRILAPFRFLRRIIRYRPELVIVTTYELLPSAVLGKLFLGYCLVYDVQENYHQNVLQNSPMPRRVRQVLAFAIKAVERATHFFIDHYFFAERSYPAELGYMRRYTLLENKYSPPDSSPVPATPAVGSAARFLLTGTITPVYGVLQGIYWFLSLQQYYPETHLKITGHVPQTNFLHDLKRRYGNHPRISLNLSGRPLPYARIRQDMLEADILLMPYEIVDSIKFKIPTKLFEAIALRKPLIISENPVWETLVNPYPAGLSVDFAQPLRAREHFEKLLTLPLYQTAPGREVLWDSEAPKLTRAVEALLS